jgi:phasin family protein
MANARPEDKSTQDMEDAARRAGERAAEQTTRIGQAAADQTARVGQAAAEAGEQVARAGADMLKQNVETLQNTWRSGLEAATSVMGRSTSNLSHARPVRRRGAKGNGGMELGRNAQTLLYSGTAAARVMGGMSREYFQMVGRQVEKNMDHMNQLWTCRTPQDFAAVQSDMVREMVETALESSRRIADMSLKMADEAGKQIKQSREEIQRTA